MRTGIGRWGTLAFKGAVRVVGLGIMASQALSTSPTDKPFLYFAALAMMGITWTIPEDLKRQRRRRDEDEE